ncbi:YceI family protein [Shewanella fidelis]|uniref:YceI family protein n=1 Tax=Shewanella fidelis TaxID=173509 RepID=A0AAW8NLN2_9GAMM|nr:YceI family protein [Shewanella fidelis]MDR8524138.1 YceI family protein [Shewanella fidelis]MDW4810685.1 YceI family protein [Shewanella fidelis]MDW4814806.1 YceI family protein [Shewanella fidelis]MDW4818896.1 YceI family protein [Shewanella fidelis]MDW4823427.1 YceI family protein [Shewanella fidelis]
MKGIITGLLLLPLSLMASAQPWKVDSDSSNVSFISIKKGDIAEVHHFKSMAGTFDDKGQFSFSVALASVATNIEIRDERMTSLLFEVDKYPKLTLTASVDPNLVKDLAVGSVKVATIDAQVDLHGEKQQMAFTVSIAKLSDTHLLIASVAPVIVNANSFGLTAGVEKLREIAGLSAISKAVPVTFSLNLTK